MKIAVLGAGGLIGREFAKLPDVLPFYHRDCDITDKDSIRFMLLSRPDIVINCAGIVKQRIKEFSPFKVIEINTLAPHVLAAECAKVNARFIQISTDCVFDGISQSSYNELSQPTPDDFYAETKLAGEVDYTTIRTSFVGPSGGLLKWAYDAPCVIGYDEEYWNGLSTAFAARLILDLVTDNCYHPLVHLSGVEYSKYEVLSIASKVFRWELDIRKGPTPENRKRSRILTSLHIPKIQVPLDVQLEMMK